MSRINDLIETLCPEGVPFKKLGEIGSFYGGLTGKSKEDFKDGNAVFITYMNVFSNIELKTDVTDRVRVGENEKQNTVQYGDVLFTGSSETPDECGMSSVLTTHTDEKLYLNSFCFGYRFDDPEMFLPGFTKHLFRSDDLRYQITRTASGVMRFNVSKKKMEDVRVPVPPLEVQREIVRVLDDFTLLSAELSAELSARRKQYEYYRNEMLTFDTSIPKIPLNNVTNGISSGKNKERLDDGKYPVYGSTGIISQTNTPVYDWQQILVARVGANAGFVHLAEGQYDVSDNTLIVDVKKEHSLKYVYYLLQNMNLNQYAKGGGQPLITAGDLKKMSVPMPKREVQDRIVNVLDNFDAICSDLNIGLPAEINARQKQYEYYRDLLLTFVETGKTILTDRQTDRQSIIKLFWYVFGFAPVLLEDICRIESGGTPSKKVSEYWNGGTIKWLGSSVCQNKKSVDEVTDYITEEGMKHSSAKMQHADTTLIAMVGATIGKVAYLTFDATTNQNVASLHPLNEDILYAPYLFYACTSLYERFAELGKNGFAMASLGFIRGLQLTLPCMERQKEIANVLDKFEKLCGDISDGIPAEIEARQKQYEYYRDKLLTFKEA